MFNFSRTAAVEERSPIGVEWRRGIILLYVAGLSVLGAYSSSIGTGVLQLFTPLFMVAASASMVGTLLGFIFGIPRKLQYQRSVPSPNEGKAESDPGNGYDANTNLEQISDWLTKIIVGASLVQLPELHKNFDGLCVFLSSSFTGVIVPPAFIMAEIVFFSILSFLFGYLWSRLYLTGEFFRADNAVKEKPEYYEGLINAFLYQPKPVGFSNAIIHALQFNKRFGSSSERVWIYLACAYGQKHAFIGRGTAPDASSLKEARDNALDAVIHALQMNPEDRAFIRSLWHESEAKPGEDDLVSLFHDPEFKRLLEEPKSPPPLESITVSPVKEQAC